jgi:hypothetical protein
METGGGETSLLTKELGLPPQDKRVFCDFEGHLGTSYWAPSEIEDFVRSSHGLYTELKPPPFPEPLSPQVRDTLANSQYCTGFWLVRDTHNTLQQTSATVWQIRPHVTPIMIRAPTPVRATNKKTKTSVLLDFQ